MLDRMVVKVKEKKQEKPVKLAPKIKSEPKKVPKTLHKSYFPKFFMLFGILLIVVGVVNFLKIMVVKLIVVNALLVAAGSWMLFMGLQKGFAKQRKEIFKKYI